MPQRILYDDASDELKKLIKELQRDSDYVIFESKDHQPIAYLTPLPDGNRARRLAGARKLREHLAQVPQSPYSEEETYRHIDEALAEIKAEEQAQANA